MEDICQEASELSLSVICVPEIISALNRRIREKRLSRHDYAIIKKNLSEDIRDAEIINLTPEVIATSTELLESLHFALWMHSMSRVPWNGVWSCLFHPTSNRSLRPRRPACRRSIFKIANM
ncbi:VapC toxin family PIN domain ribonuclease [Thermodesulfobacteriota bacterium]